MIEYLSEMETEFENTLACLSGAQMGSNHEKTGGRKSRDTLPLSCINILGYLRSVLEDSKPYARMKLMVVGVQV